MQKLLITIVGAVLASLSIAAVTATGHSPPVSTGVPLIPFPTNDFRPVVEPPATGPGRYQSAPFTLLVIIPEPIDQRMLIEVENTAPFKMPCIKPELDLESR